MKTRDTILGLVVLALVAAGVFLARSRPWPGREPSPQPSGAAEVAQPPTDDGLPDVTLADGSADAGRARVTLSVAPHPPVAFAGMRVRVRAEVGGRPVMLEGGIVSFEMTMPMGDHRYSLKPDREGWQEADVVLPACPSGRRRWYATIVGDAAGEPVKVRFRFDLSPPP